MNGKTTKEIRNYLKKNLGKDSGSEFKMIFRRLKKAYTRLNIIDKKKFLIDIRKEMASDG